MGKQRKDGKKAEGKDAPLYYARDRQKKSDGGE
jgi:hypothetical protein